MPTTIYFAHPKHDDDERGFGVTSTAASYKPDAVWRMQGNNMTGSKIDPEWWSLSVGDVVETDCGTRHYCASVGWRTLTDDQWSTWKAASRRDRPFLDFTA